MNDWCHHFRYFRTNWPSFVGETMHPQPCVTINEPFKPPPFATSSAAKAQSIGLAISPPPAVPGPLASAATSKPALAPRIGVALALSFSVHIFSPSTRLKGPQVSIHYPNWMIGDERSGSKLLSHPRPAERTGTGTGGQGY